MPKLSNPISGRRLMEPTCVNWHGKPYYSLDAYCKNTYGEKLYKIAINAGLSCPNRDGTLGTGGCIFCSAGGSGDFAVDRSQFPSIKEQLLAGKALFHTKKTGSRYIAYFQAYTNTYGSPDYLYSLFSEALREPDVAGISIATRSDCLPPEVMTVLVNIRQEFTDKFVWIELGLQTIHSETADFIRRGYPLQVYDDAVTSLQSADIPVITHLIVGLPGETEAHLLQTIKHMNEIGTWGIKLQLLHVLKGTDLGRLYADAVPLSIGCPPGQSAPYHPLEKEEYIDLLIRALSHLSPSVVIHRLTGDAPRDLLLAPRWSLDKRGVLNTLHQQMKKQQIRQGCLFPGEKDSQIL